MKIKQDHVGDSFLSINYKSILSLGLLFTLYITFVYFILFSDQKSANVAFRSIMAGFLFFVAFNIRYYWSAINVHDCVRLFFALMLWGGVSFYWSDGTSELRHVLGKLLATVAFVLLLYRIHAKYSLHSHFFAYNLGALYATVGLYHFAIWLFSGQAYNRFELGEGVFGSHISVAISMAFGLFVLLFYTFERAWWRSAKILFIIPTAILLLSAIVVSQGRSGILLAGLAIFAYLVKNLKKHQIKPVLLVIALLALGTSGLLYLFGPSELQNIPDRVLNGRLEIWGNAFELITASWGNFLFGVGFGSDQTNLIGTYLAAHYHNLFISFWVQLGLFGMLLLMYIMYQVAVQAFKTLPHTPWPYLLVGFYGTTCFQGYSLFYYAEYHQFTFNLVLWVCMLSYFKHQQKN